MAITQWDAAVEAIAPHIVRISTPRGRGTGFLISNGKNQQVCGVATAAHVIEHAHSWEEPIRIEHTSSTKSRVIRSNQRAIFIDPGRDTAAILFNREDLPLPLSTLPLAPHKMHLRTGFEIGWLGFPAISSDLCFFAGRVSAFIEKESAYLVDGVTINGVSGGPAFDLSTGDLLLMGVVSAYMPNRATGETLPGLGVIRDVTQFHELAPTFASLEQAKAEETPTNADQGSPHNEPPQANPTKSAT